MSRFNCIHCLAPSSTLFQKYSESTIRLSQCSGCQQNVDPYCEREWLLVLIDVVLLREQAYRHVLCNRLHEFSKRLDVRKSIQIALAAGILQAYLLLESHRENASRWSSGREEAVGWRSFSELLLLSLFQMAALNVGILTSLSLLANQHEEKTQENRIKLVYRATILPSALHIVTVLVLIWENTGTIRFWGSLLVLAYQSMAIRVVAEMLCAHKNAFIVVVLCGIVLRAMATLTWSLVTLKPSPCCGMQWSEHGVTICFS